MGMATQTNEDALPRRSVPWTVHQNGTAREFLRIALPVRLPLDLYPRCRVVIRAYQGSDSVTMTVEAIRVE